MKLLNPLMIGKFRKYRSVQADCIAAAMVSLAHSGPNDQIIESDMIQNICNPNS